MSLRRLSQETRIYLTSTHRAVHELKFFPYKVHVVHELKPVSSKFPGWFQQDGATAHTARVSMAAVGEVFGDRVISCGLWPPRSPDLTPPDFFCGAN